MSEADTLLLSGASTLYTRKARVDLSRRVQAVTVKLALELSNLSLSSGF